MKKRVFSILLVLVMLFSMVPMQVFSVETTVGDGTAENPYQIGDIVTNDGSAEPEGVTVSNAYWARTDVPASQSTVCQLEEHDHETALCQTADATVECTQSGHPTEGELSTCRHEDGTNCTYNAEQNKWYTTASVYTCGKEEHAHTVDAGCIVETAAYTLWTLTAQTPSNDGIMVVDETTYTVTFYATYNNSAVRYMEIMIVDAAGNTVDYVETGWRGTATYSLANGTYKAIASYTSGNYSYYLEQEFTVNGAGTTVNLPLVRTYSQTAAQSTYNNTTYFNHLDIRVMGTYTTGSTTDLTTYNIRLANVKVQVVNPEEYSEYNFTRSYTDNSQTYEWRATTGVQVYKGAKVILTCDIYDSETNEVLKSGFTYTFYDGVHDGVDHGSTEFVKAIQQCDAHQGLDFIIDPLDIIEAVFYGVRYDWDVVDASGNYVGELPAGVATLPAAVEDEYESGEAHTIDPHHTEGHYVTYEDTTTGKMYVYTFHGWDWWSLESDNNLKKNVIASDATTVTITDETVIYGVWTVEEMALAESHMTLTKKFVDSEGNTIDAPATYHMMVTGPRGGSAEIALGQFTYDEDTGVYTYELPVYTEGEFTIAEHEYSIAGYEDAEAVTVKESSTATASGHDHITAGEVTAAAADSATFTVDLDYATGTPCAHVGEVNFVNTYTKITGEDVYNYPNLTVDKLDADDRSVLEGATFALYKNYDPATNQLSTQVAIGTSDESGYINFNNLAPGTYYLWETNAPEGYMAGFALYKVSVTLKDGFPKEILSEGKWVKYYEYDMAVEYTVDNGKTWQDSQHFSVGTTGHRFRLAAFNEKISGELTITKAFNGVDADHLPESITVTVTYPDGTTKDVTLNAGNSWTQTLSGLELGTYTLSETIVRLAGYEFKGVTYNGNTSGTITLSKSDVPADYDKNNPVAEKAVEVKNTYSKVTDERHVYPNLKVLKVRDANNAPLSGATFELYGYNDETGEYDVLVTDGSTNAQGELLFQVLKEETYHLVETKAPAGYAENSTVYKVVVSNTSDGEETLEDDKHVTVKYYDVTVTDLDGKAVDLFNAESNQLTVQNTKDEGTLTIKKTFGVNNAYIPSSINVTVTKPDGSTQNVELSPSNNWTVTLTGLPLGDYVVIEDQAVTKVEGYPLYTDKSQLTVNVTLSSGVEEGVDLSEGTAQLVNTYTKEVVNPASFQIKKVDSITGELILTNAEFTLYADVDCTEVVHTENTGTDGIATFYGFAEDKTYYLKETSAPQYYTASETVWKVDVDLKNGTATVKVNETTNIWETIYDWIIGSVDPGSEWAGNVLTVKNVKKLGDLTITKTVTDPENRNTDAEYTFKLDCSDDTFDQTFTLKKGETKTIEDIPYGTKYTVTEDTTGAAYTSSVTNGAGKIEAATTAVTVTNTYAYQENYPGLNLAKVDGEANTVIAGAGFTLYSDEDCKTKVAEGTTDADGKLNLAIPFTAATTNYYLKETTTPDGYHPNSTVYTVTATPEYVVKNAGTDTAYTEKQLVITVAELGEPTTDATNTIKHTYTVKNTLIKKVVINVHKDWDDDGYYNRPASVEVTLYKDGVERDTVTLNETNNWNHKWIGDEYTDEHVWSVDEKTVPGEYTKAVVNENGNWTITNTRTPKDIEITVTKAWNHNGGKELPESVTVTLYKNGQAHESKELSEKNGWTYTWTGLKDSAEWSLDETVVPAGYEKEISVDGYKFTVTNTRTINKLDVSVKKVWVASEGVVHPESVEAVLYRDGEAYKTVTLNAQNNWSYTWKDLTDEYTWNVDEKEVPEGYTKNVTSKDNAFTITNTKNFKNIDVSVNKIWYGTNVTHPGSVKVTLYRDGVAFDTQTLSADNKWSYTWAGLTDEFVWTVDEASVPSGYNKTVRQSGNSFTITNTHEDIPKTGDGSSADQWRLLTAVGAFGFLLCAVLVLLPRKKKGKYAR